MPMIRRFSKVVIVGKLNKEQRVTLLKQFLQGLPTSDRFTDEVWDRAAEKLEHATGDVVRKVCDHVWRSEIARFIKEKPEDAERMLTIIGKLAYDVKTGVKPDVLEDRKADEEIDEYHLGGKEKTSRREKFQREFSRVFEIHPDVVYDAIDAALGNIGIINEIETAKRTYEEAELFLAQVKQNRIQGKEEDEESE